MVKHRSVSQVNEYTKCPYAYYLNRVQREWKRPAAWLSQGSAVHEAAEAWEKSMRTMTLDEAQEVYTESYDKHTGVLCEDTPRFDYWFASGPYGGQTDVERRYGLGLAQVERYIDYYALNPDEVPWVTPDGQLAVELPFDVTFGDVQVKGYIDGVMVHPTRGPGSRDVKSGNKPGDSFQLATYNGAMKLAYGVDMWWGDYWMGRNGKPTVVYNLREWTVERLTDVYGETNQMINDEKFDPDPEPSKCRFCSVSASCQFSV